MPNDSSFDSLLVGVPPKSPDHSDVNTARIATQTHQEAHSLKASGDVWRYRRLSETSASLLVPPQRSDTDADTFLPTSRSSAKRSRERILGWLARSGHTDAGSDIEQALHIHIATVLSSPI